MLIKKSFISRLYFLYCFDICLGTVTEYNENENDGIENSFSTATSCIETTSEFEAINNSKEHSLDEQRNKLMGIDDKFDESIDLINLSMARVIVSEQKAAVSRSEMITSIFMSQNKIYEEEFLPQIESFIAEIDSLKAIIFPSVSIDYNFSIDSYAEQNKNFQELSERLYYDIKESLENLKNQQKKIATVSKYPYESDMINIDSAKLKILEEELKKLELINKTKSNGTQK